MLTLGEEAVKKVEELRPDVVIMDVRLGGRLDGIEAARIIRRGWQGPILFHTAETDAAAREAMAALGVLAPKPAAPRKVADIVLGLVAAGPFEPAGRSLGAARSPSAWD
jgi:CheY-like chemotaxis protein